MKRFLLLLSLLILAIPLANAVEQVFNVNLTKDFPDALPGDGKCSHVKDPPNPFVNVCTLRAAIMEANATDEKDTINLKGGVTYKLSLEGGNEDGGATGDLDILRPVIIQASFSNTKAIIDASELDRVFHLGILADGTELRNLEITGGNPGIGAHGGGILSRAKNVVISHCDIYGNTAQDGAAIRSEVVSSFSLSHSNVFMNQGESAIYHATSLPATIEHSAIFENQGHGIEVQNTTALKLGNSTVSFNDGLGLLALNSNAYLLNNTMVENGHLDLAMNLRFYTFNPGIQTLYMLGNALSNSVRPNCSLEIGQEDAYQIDWTVSSDSSCNPQGMGGVNSLHGTPLYLSTLGHWGGPTLSHRPQRSPVIDRGTLPVCANYSADQRLKGRPVAYAEASTPCDIGAVELETDVIFFDQYEYH